MTQNFRKLMRAQVQESLNAFKALIIKPIPQGGWVRTIRDALGMSSYALANRLGCSQANVALIEKSEKKKTISLDTLETVANALNCKLVYCLIPLESLDEILENQAKKVAHEKIKIINHSMKLEQQGLTAKQLQQQEDDLVRELLQGNPKKLWSIE